MLDKRKLYKHLLKKACLVFGVHMVTKLNMALNASKSACSVKGDWVSSIKNSITTLLGKHNSNYTMNSKSTHHIFVMHSLHDPHGYCALRLLPVHTEDPTELDLWSLCFGLRRNIFFAKARSLIHQCLALLVFCCGPPS